MRVYNERLILSLIRRYGELPKADLTRLTGLSAQTVSVIVRALEADGLLLRMKPQREGRVGQPSVPLRLDPNGAFSLGLTIGRRSADLILMDFTGNIRHSVHWTYSYPVPDEILAMLQNGIDQLIAEMSSEHKKRIVGLGLAVPNEIWKWAKEIAAPQKVLDEWRNLNLQTAIESKCAFPVFVSNDITAATGAELVFGQAHKYPDFVYFFVGDFVGGGVVLGGILYPGRLGNAGALGSMPVPKAKPDRSGKWKLEQLIRRASLFQLERRLAERGFDPSTIFHSPEHWGRFDPLLSDWIDAAAEGMAFAIVAAVSVIDFGAAIIDGAFPVEVRKRLVECVNRKISKFDLQGLSPFEIVEGSIGANARSIGGACVPLFARYLLDRDVIFKDGA